MFGYNTSFLTYTVSSLDPNNSVIKGLWCNFNHLDRSKPRLLLVLLQEVWIKDFSSPAELLKWNHPCGQLDESEIYYKPSLLDWQPVLTQIRLLHMHSDLSLHHLQMHTYLDSPITRVKVNFTHLYSVTCSAGLASLPPPLSHCLRPAGETFLCCSGVGYLSLS